MAENRSEEGYIVKEDFLRFFNLPGLLGGKYIEVEWKEERQFIKIDANHDGKIFWSEFKKGIEVCMLDDETGFDSFIFHFFSLNEYV